MFRYKDLYKELGNLLYAIAFTDGKISKPEKEKVIDLVQYNWRHLEDSTDQFLTDAANVILFQFDFNEENCTPTDDAYQSFADFYFINKDKINDYLKEKIMMSARSVAESTRRINDKELKTLMKLHELLAHPKTIREIS